MCGRFSRTTPADRFAALVGADCDLDPDPRYNILPGQSLLTCRVDDQGRRRMVMMHWPYIPPFEPEPRTRYSTINARAETLSHSRLWRFPARHFRCLIAADGFFEPRDTGEKRKPQYYFHRRDGEPFFMAGVWSRWEPPKDSDHGPFDSCAIVTTEANAIVGEVHGRMPVILEPADYSTWLNPGITDMAALAGMLDPAPADHWVGYHVGQYTREDHADVIGPARSASGH